MSSRRDFKQSGRNARDERAKPAPRRGGALLLGMLLGLVGALVIVAILVWFFYAKPSEFKTPERAPEVIAPRMAEPVQTDAPPAVAEPSPKSDEAARPAGTGAPSAPYSFYDILPGSKPPKPVEPAIPKELWWLQVAALKAPEDADRLKARLALLNLDTVVQQVQGADTMLYRVRVGPFKSEDAALGALDTLAVNNFEPRLLKEAVSP